MNTKENSIEEKQTGTETSWGPILFYATLIAVLIFFWWMVIYDHGVSTSH